MWELPEELGALQMHVYCYGVLSAMEHELRLRGGSDDVPGARTASSAEG